MGAIYGEMLLYFPELLREFSVYKPSPKGVAGYEKVKVNKKD